MSTLKHAQTRVDSVLDEIDRLKQSEFPYTHPKDALELVDAVFRKHQQVLSKASPQSQPEVVRSACTASLMALRNYVPILGFVLRATDVRNAFEAYGPLQRLADKATGTKTKLIVSSEWELSPFVYCAMPELTGFVLIGLPAPESTNPLLLPLAGHELGHSVWETEGLGREFERKVEAQLLKTLLECRWNDYQRLNPQYTKEQVNSDVLPWRSLSLAYSWAVFQVQESFCDFFGLRLFAESFLHAFAYLLAPGPVARSPHYPGIKQRIGQLMSFARETAIEVPEGYASYFEGETESDDQMTAFLVSLADDVSASLSPEVAARAKSLADERQVPVRNVLAVNQVLDGFRKFVVPTRERETLVDILNAGWRCRTEDGLWEGIPQVRIDARSRILKDLVLKSMEITEIYDRLSELR